MHEDEGCGLFSSADIVRRLSSITFPRALLLAMFAGLLFLLLTGMLGGPAWDWKKITFTIGALFALFVVLTVPDHFLERHLWEHGLKRHLLRVFLWTFGVLLVVHYLKGFIDIKA